MSKKNIATANNSHPHPLISTIDQNLKTNKRQLFLEIRTTEFEPFEDNRIVEIGIIELIDRQVSGNVFHVYLNPERSVDGSDFELGLSDEFLSSKPLFVDIADELESFVNGAEIITHGSNFLMHFFDREWQLAGQMARFGTFQIVELLAIANSKFPKRRNSLEELASLFNVKRRDSNLHSALLEAEFVAKVYLHLTNDALIERTKLEHDPVYKDVVEYVIKTQIVNVITIQRKFELGYGRAAAMIDALEKNNIVSPRGIAGTQFVLIKWQP